MTNKQTFQQRFFYSAGTILVEFLIVAALLTLAIPAIYGLFLVGSDSDANQLKQTEATRMMREMVEVTRIIREQGWDAFANNGTYYPNRVGNSWELVTGEETTGEFTRSMIIEDVYRDSNDSIVESGGELDLSTKKVQYRASWNVPFPGGTITSTKYYTRYLDTIAFTHTLNTDFSSGSFTNTEVTNTLDGEVILSGGTSGEYESAPLDAEQSSSFAYLYFTEYAPDDSDIKIQVAVADPVSGNCATANYEYVGPDGTDTSYFDPSGPVPFDGDSSGYENPGQCFRYKVFFENIAQTEQPELRSVTITYTP